MKKSFYLLLTLFLIISCKKEEEKPIIPDPPLSTSIKIIHDQIEGTPIVIIGSPGLNFIVSFKRELTDGTQLTFIAIPNTLPIIMEDNEGNKWDFFGNAIEGPRAGQQLIPTYSYMGYWFAWGTMFPAIEIYEGAPSPEFETQLPAENWTIPTDHVFQGTGADAIPSIDEPIFIQYRGRDFLDNEFYVKDDDLVIGVKMGDDYKLYPHAILNWHEIVNDEMNNLPFSLSFCPLTGTAIAWNREINGEITTFGVSGLLYNNNLIPYDRSTESFWSQMQADCINGALIGQQLETFPILETTWLTWKTIIGEPTILSKETGYNRNYTNSPYGDYDTNNNYIAFPVAFDDDRLQKKERVHGVIINGKARVYRFDSF